MGRRSHSQTLHLWANGQRNPEVVAGILGRAVLVRIHHFEQVRAELPLVFRSRSPTRSSAACSTQRSHSNGWRPANRNNMLEAETRER